MSEKHDTSLLLMGYKETKKKIEEFTTSLNRKIDNYESRLRLLREEIDYLKSENYKDSELNKMREELEKVKEEASLGFKITAEESAKIREWINAHEEKAHPYEGKIIPRGGAIGGCYTYYFTPTNIGTVGTVKCVCGAGFTFKE